MSGDPLWLPLRKGEKPTSHTPFLGESPLPYGFYGRFRRTRRTLDTLIQFKVDPKVIPMRAYPEESFPASTWRRFGDSFKKPDF